MDEEFYQPYRFFFLSTDDFCQATDNSYKSWEPPQKGVAGRLFEQSTLLEHINGDVDHFLSITVDSDWGSDIYGTFYNQVDRNECDVINGRGAYRGCSRKLQWRNVCKMFWNKAIWKI